MRVRRAQHLAGRRWLHEPEIKVSFLRPITAETGAVTAHGWVTRRGRSASFAEADIRDSEGRVLATASSTCLIIQPGPTQ